MENNSNPTEKKKPTVSFKGPVTLQTFENPAGMDAPEGLVCGPEGCVVPERAVDAASSVEKNSPKR